MTKYFLLLAFSLASHSIFSQGSYTSNAKYEYALIVQSTDLTKPYTLDVIYPDGEVEEFSKLKGFETTKNYYKNLGTRIKAFNYLADKGFEFVDSMPDFKAIEGDEVYLFRREKR